MSDQFGGGDLGTALATMEYGPLPDILAGRYATDPMKRIWSPEGSAMIERHFQMEIMQVQSELGVDIPAANIADYRRVADSIDLAEMTARERVSQHDVAARISVFNDLAGHQNISEAMTSRDTTDNAEQFQKRLGLELIRGKVVASIGSFSRAAANYAELPITGRSHNVAAQMTTLGKRFATNGEEMMDGHSRFSFHLDNLKLRGIKGAVGTQQDMLDLFDGDEDAVDDLDQRVAAFLGFNEVYNSVGQIYPRSEDLAAIQALSHVVGPLSNFATNIRHMMGNGLATESTKKRFGSNAMPHKVNPRTSERIVGLYGVIGGFEAMIRPKAGEQWMEGDVSDSVLRRIALPGSFNAADGAFEAGLTVLNGFGLFESVISAEVDRNLPFLATTKVLTGSIKRGAQREDTHALISQHARDVVESMRRDSRAPNDLLQRLGADDKIPMTIDEIMGAVERPIELTGRANTQVRRFVAQAEKVISAHGSGANYEAGDIL